MRTLLCLGVFLTCATASATVWHVDAGASPGGDGTSWGSAVRVIGSAVQLASAGDEVWIRGATYAEMLELRDGVTVRGGFLGAEDTAEERISGATETVLTLRAWCEGVVSGATADRLVWRSEAGGIDVYSATLAIQDSLIEGANRVWGGGIHAVFSTLYINRSALRGNVVRARQIQPGLTDVEGGYGGGVYALDSQLMIRDSIFVDGLADAGGIQGGEGAGVWAMYSGVDVVDSTFARNRCTDFCYWYTPTPGHTYYFCNRSYGGGIFAWGGDHFTMSGCHLNKNDADTGAALSVGASSIMVTNCVFSANQGHPVQDSGGINFPVAGVDSHPGARGVFSLSDCIFIGNKGPSVYCQIGEVRDCLFVKNDEDYETVSGYLIHVLSTTITGNSGGGVYSNGRVENCVIWDNGPFEVEGEPEIAYSLVKGGAPGAGVIDADPLFVDPENGNYRLLPGSPCIDSGTDLPELTTDLDGRPRPLGAGWDMGAYEFDPETSDWDEDRLFDTLEGQPPTPGQTNRLLPDSDGDGLPDGTEDANRNGQRDPGETDARALDSDGDGLWDGIEVLLLASDPLDAGDPASYTDGDGDGLPGVVSGVLSTAFKRNLLRPPEGGTQNLGSAVVSPVPPRRVSFRRSSAPSASGGAGGGVFLDPNDANPDTDDDRFTDGYEAVAIGPEAVTSATQVPALGDVTGDGAVSNADALAVLALFITKIGPDAGVFQGTGFRYADPSRDGYISNKDALLIQSFFLGNVPVLPWP